VGFQKRQCRFDIDISKVVTELLRLIILENEQTGTSKGLLVNSPKVLTYVLFNMVLVSKLMRFTYHNYQLLPWGTALKNTFLKPFQLGIPISAGSLFNFNEQAAALW
jgi:transposase